MRDLDLDPIHAHVYAALGSPVRLSILSHLVSGPANQKQLSDRLGLTSAMVGLHLDKLEAAGLVRLERVLTKQGAEKHASLCESALRVDLTKPAAADPEVRELSVPVGHYVDFAVSSPCGLATSERIIGVVDDPRYFLDSQRVDAGILWFVNGAITYRFPVFHPHDLPIHALTISFEAGSEARGFAMDWPSRISIRLNGIDVGAFVLPGDFADRPGRLSPPYWRIKTMNQYGVLKTLRVDGTGTSVDGVLRSGVGLPTIFAQGQDFLLFELSCQDPLTPTGGLTLYGKDFGDHPQDIHIRYEA